MCLTVQKVDGHLLSIDEDLEDVSVDQHEDINDDGFGDYEIVDMQDLEQKDAPNTQVCFVAIVVVVRKSSLMF